MKSAVDVRAVSEAQHAVKIAEAKTLFKGGGILAIKHLPEDHSWKGNPRVKLIHFIRHGQGYHNLLGQVSRNYGAEFSETGDYEVAIKEQCPYMLPAIQDPPLTALGRADARKLRVTAAHITPDLLVTSPLRRASETILLAFPSSSTPLIAHEGCREQIGVFLCDKRSDVTDYTEDGRYARIDFAHLTSNTDTLWQATRRESVVDMATRGESFLHFLRDRPEREIVVGTHSSWLMALFNLVLDVESGASSAEEAAQLRTFFETGEMRSMLLHF